MFLAVLNPSLSNLLFSTYLGGTGDDYGFGLALDSAGNAYVAGQTLSTDFPTTSGAYETTAPNPGAYMGIVFKVTPVVFVRPHRSPSPAPAVSRRAQPAPSPSRP